MNIGKRNAVSLFLLLMLTGFGSARAGIVGIDYSESRNGFSLSIKGDAVDSDRTHVLSFGSDWSLGVFINEIDAAIDQLVFNVTAQHLVPNAGPIFDIDGVASGNTGGGAFSPFLALLAHNTSFDTFAGNFNFITTPISFPPPEETDQILGWNLSLTGTHIPEPGTILLMLLGVLLVVQSSSKRRERLRGSHTEHRVYHAES